MQKGSKLKYNRPNGVMKVVSRADLDYEVSVKNWNCI